MVRKIPVWLLLMALLALVSGCATNPVTGRNELAFYQMSEGQEIDLGQKAFPKAIQQMKGEYHDPVLAAYLTGVGNKLAAVSHRPHLPYQFKVVNDSTPNAFALPGGPIAITRGLLIGIENEAQLAAVLGHEVGHVTARHAAQGVQRGLLLNLGLVILSEATADVSYSAVARQAGEAAAVIIDSSYSREQESESDRLGIDYMVRAGYDPQGAVQLQEFFLKQSGARDPLWIEGLFRTHPFSRDRMVANQYYISSRYPMTRNNAEYVLGKEGFQAATAGLRKTGKAYALYDQGKEAEREGKLDRAVDLYRQAVAAASEQGVLQAALGLGLLQKKDIVQARVHLEKALALDNAYYESHLGMGYILLQQNDLNGAISELRHSMNLLPTLEGAFFLAEAYERTGDLRRAASLYQQVAVADPKGRTGKTAADRLRFLTGGRPF